MKRITLYFFILFALFSVPQLMAQQRNHTGTVQDEQKKIILTVVDNSVRVQNAPVNSELEVYNIVGIKVASDRIDSQDKTLQFNLPKGYYILKINNIVRKIVIK